jgi:hypothetical protein
VRAAHRKQIRFRPPSKDYFSGDDSMAPLLFPDRGRAGMRQQEAFFPPRKQEIAQRRRIVLAVGTQVSLRFLSRRRAWGCRSAGRKHSPTAHNKTPPDLMIRRVT